MSAVDKLTFKIKIERAEGTLIETHFKLEPAIRAWDRHNHAEVITDGEIQYTRTDPYGNVVGHGALIHVDPDFGTYVNPGLKW